jgi:ABC-type sugar transport system ATPase subunit
MSDVSLIDARGIVRHFGHVQALQGADFSVGRGEIVGLIGENGAVKKIDTQLTYQAQQKYRSKP